MNVSSLVLCWAHAAGSSVVVLAAGRIRLTHRDRSLVLRRPSPYRYSSHAPPVESLMTQVQPPPMLAAPSDPLSTPDPASGLRWHRWIPWLLLLVGALAYLRGLQAGFVFDDHPHIVNNPALHEVMPNLRQVIQPRGLVSLTLAINYAIEGREPRGFHLVNIAFHLLAGLALYGLAWRTLHLSKLAATLTQARLVGAALALLWLVHPLQTQAVTYVIQRAEVFAGFWFILGLYSLVRHHQSVGAHARLGWTLAMFGCIFAALLSKESGAVLPVVMVLYDRCFLAGRFGVALRERRWLYGVCAAFFVLAVVWIFRRVASETSAGFFMSSRTPLTYLFTQPGVILHYLRQTFWPHPLVFDYLWPIATQVRQQVPQTITLVALGVLTLWALVRNHPLGVAGAWFFITLAPTSSFVPIADVCVEHRMYLPLAAVLALVVVGGWRLLSGWLPGQPARWVGGSLLVLTAAALALLTSERNRDYRSDLTLWRTVVEARPRNPRAHMNYASALVEHAGDFERAVPHLRRAATLSPRYADAYTNLASAYLGLNQREEAQRALGWAAALEPNSPWVLWQQGNLAHLNKDLSKAQELLKQSIALNPIFAPPYVNLAQVLKDAGQLAEAQDALRRATELAPQRPQAWAQWADLKLQMNEPQEALRLARHALTIPTADAGTVGVVGSVLAKTGEVDLAIACMLRSAQLRPTAATYNNLAGALLLKGRYSDALGFYGKALKLGPRDVALVRRVAWLLATLPDERYRNAAESLAMARWLHQRTQAATARDWQILAAALANAGQMDEAIHAQQQALDLLGQDGQSLRPAMQEQLELYRSGRPLRLAPSLD
jgi:tetratricopeptide (TPR) repeat protein